MKTRKQVMKRRRAVTYTVFFIVLLLVIIGLNNLLLEANLRSLRNAPEMVWYNGTYMEASAVENLTRKEVVNPPVWEDSIKELPIREFLMGVEEKAKQPSSKTPSSRRVAPISVTEEEYDILLKIGMAEAAGEPIEGVRAVYTVIFNRMAANHLGESTVKGTIFKPYQFSGVGVGQWHTEPSDKIKSALDDVLAGYRSFGPEILFYHYREVATDRAQVNRVTVKYKIGVHEFGVIK